MNEPATVDELISVCIARQMEDGDLWAQGIATPLVMAGLLLGKLTRAPQAWFASAIGQGVCREWAPLGLAYVEKQWIGQALVSLGFVTVACELLPRFCPKEFFRPAQVDATGHFNNIIIGHSYERPRLRLPGCGGIADVTTFSRHSYLYVPRHSRTVFVETLDFVSGLGHSPARRAGSGPHYCVTDLGEFDFAHGRMRLIRTFPGQTPASIQARTGFELEVAPDLAPTPPPTPEELDLLRHVIDPLGIRRLETLSGPARQQVLHEILTQEKCNRSDRGPFYRRDAEDTEKAKGTSALSAPLR